MSDENSRCPYCNADLGEYGTFMANWSQCNKCDRKWSEIAGKDISSFYFDKCPKCGSTSLQVGCSGARLCNDCQTMWTPGEEDKATNSSGGGCCGGSCCGGSSSSSSSSSSNSSSSSSSNSSSDSEDASESESESSTSSDESTSSSSTPKCSSCGKDNPLVSWPPDKRSCYMSNKCYDCYSKKSKGNGACSGYNKCKKKGRDCQKKCASAKSAAASGKFSVLSDLHIKLIEPALKACCAHCGVGYSPPE